MASEMEDWNVRLECQTASVIAVEACSNDLIKGLVESLPEVTVPEYLRYL